jgi:hypothetical protein
VNGPVRKEGLINKDRFLFPVGKNNMHRWLELKNVTGSYTVEYIRANPHSLSLATATGIDHISGLEYWTVKADASPASSAGIELSFDNINSGGVTNLSRLLLARLNGGIWTSMGSVSITGNASKGSLIAGNTVTNFNTVDGDFFTLATDISSANPLPFVDRLASPLQLAQRNVLFTKLLYAAPSLIQGNTIMLNVLAEKEEQIRIAFTNYPGQVMRVQRFSLSKGSNKLLLDVSGLSSGIYHITGYTTGGTTNTIRCIKY